MDMESTSRDTARESDTLGADNADILAAKRRRDTQPATRPTTDAAALRARMASAAKNTASAPRATSQSTLSGMTGSSGVSGAKPTRPASSVAGTEPQNPPATVPSGVHPVAKAAASTHAPATSHADTHTVRPSASAPATPKTGAHSATASTTHGSAQQVATAASIAKKTSAPTPKTTVSDSRPQTAMQASAKPATPRSSAVSLPVPKKKPVSAADATRVTDITAVRASRDAGETRLHNRTAVEPKPLVPVQNAEEKDESEAGNTIISVIKAITYIVAVVVVSVFLSVFVILVGNDIYAFVKPDTLVEVQVPEYATLNDISTLLDENGIIEYPAIFKIYASLKDDGKNAGVFLAGTYSLSPMMNYDELIAAFKPKKPSGVSRITIPEGYTTDEIIDLLVSKGIGTREGYVDVINNYDFDYWFIDALEEDGIPTGRYYRLDGYLFPDTYEFYNASTEEVVIGKLLRRFNEVFPASYAQKAEELGYTVDQILIIASLIEKEAGSQADFFDISSVFNNRLKDPANYPYLESDATIVYAIEHERGEHITPTAEDIAYESIYNTYKHPGFPPGPIANPSASAIRAALYPSDTKYHFFVSASARLTYFAETRAEHEANIERIKNGTNTEQIEGENPGA